MTLNHVLGQMTTRNGANLAELTSVSSTAAREPKSKQEDDFKSFYLWYRQDIWESEPQVMAADAVINLIRRATVSTFKLLPISRHLCLVVSSSGYSKKGKGWSREKIEELIWSFCSPKLAGKQCRLAISFGLKNLKSFLSIWTLLLELSTGRMANMLPVPSVFRP